MNVVDVESWLLNE